VREAISLTKEIQNLGTAHFYSLLYTFSKTFCLSRLQKRSIVLKRGKGKENISETAKQKKRFSYERKVSRVS